MQIIVFSKRYASQTIAELIETAHEYDFDGYDLCIRPGHPVTPENVGATLAPAAKAMRQAGLAIPVVTSDTALTSPDHPTAEPILAAMDAADIRMIKLGYTVFDPLRQEYWAEVDRIRRNNDVWQVLAKRYNVKVCYHTHNERVMGINGAALCHLINGFDPQYIGAYLDPTHLVLEGEEFAFALAMVQQYLSVVSGKDVIKFRVEKSGHGGYGYRGVPAGEGFVDWTAVFSDLRRVGYEGPLSAHCEWHLDDEDAVFDVLRREISFFRHQSDRARG
jgi:sugar phosphate isomerase/epimerase